MALCLLQTSSDERSTILKDLPWIGALMVVVSFALHYIPALYSLFTSRDRLAGFFQYPNTFACFMLLGIEILILNEEKINVRRVLCALVLVFGLVQSGSRTVFVLAIPALLVSLFIRLRKNPKALVIGAAAIVLAFAVMILALGGSYSVSHLLALSASESTLLGRLLYWKDALPVIGNHPFGLGYLGYYMSHGSFQTGLYSVRWVHNELLQMLLDIGWIPTVIAIVAVVKAVAAKQPAVRKVVLLTLLAHCMMDFDLEYIAMYFILLVCLDWDTGKTKTVKLTVPVKAVAAVLILGSLYIGVGSTLYYSGKVEASVKVYPWNTQARMELLTQAETAEEMDEQAMRSWRSMTTLPLRGTGEGRGGVRSGRLRSGDRRQEQCVGKHQVHKRRVCRLLQQACRRISAVYASRRHEKRTDMPGRDYRDTRPHRPRPRIHR